MEQKRAPVAYEVIELVRERWSPRAFSEQPIDWSTLRSLLEAARWAPSCFNDQPWQVLVARRDQPEAFANVLSCLNEPNQVWAQHASVLLVTVARMTFRLNGKDNAYAWHDIGLAMGQLTLQARSLGIGVHQMAGFSADKARELFSIPEGFAPVSAVALGYYGDPASLPEALEARERAQSTRFPQEEWVFSGAWDTALVQPEEQAIEDVLSFWLRETDEYGMTVNGAHMWKKDEAFDKEIRDKFLGLHQAILAGEKEHWLRSVRGRLAYIIVLDQFSRNMFRGTGEMYSGDERVYAVAKEMVDAGLEKSLGVTSRMLVYMPFMHWESLEAQDRCIALFEAFRDEFEEGPVHKALSSNVDFAIKHRDIVAQFGRFPHRNALLARPSTPEEEAFLKQPGSSF